MEARLDDLTQAQRDTLDYLRTYITDHGHAPQVRDMLEPLGVSSTSTIQGRLDSLEAAGYIERVGMRMVIKIKETT